MYVGGRLADYCGDFLAGLEIDSLSRLVNPRWQKPSCRRAAEPIDRKVAAPTAKLLGDIHPLAIHRRHNLVLTLILPGKLE